MTEILTAAELIYFSSKSENTHRFVSRLPFTAARLAISAQEPALVATRPFVLVTPTFADGEGRGAVPKPVIRFLNNPANRALLRGVIAGGNRNFGTTYGIAGDVISAKCGVPMLYRFELAGTEKDLDEITRGLPTILRPKAA